MVKINDVLTFGDFAEVDELLDPFACNSPLRLDADVSVPEHIMMLTSMLVVRTAEQRLAEARRDGTIGGPVHLGIGQEAILSRLAGKSMSETAFSVRTDLTVTFWL